MWNTPIDAPGIVDYDSAIFVQDTWTIKRLTINPGVRIEWFSAGMRAASARSRPLRAGTVLSRGARPDEMGTRLRPAFRGGVRLFGNGRTAIKTNFSKYHRQYDADPAAAYSPTSASSARTATGSTAC